jgi:hypothetical protein
MAGQEGRWKKKTLNPRGRPARVVVFIIIM